MSSSCRSIQRPTDKQELYEFINWSSRHPMEDEDDIAQYFRKFKALSKPLLYFNSMSRTECDKLF
jgi:hypothetical protein